MKRRHLNSGHQYLIKIHIENMSVLSNLCAFDILSCGLIKRSQVRRGMGFRLNAPTCGISFILQDLSRYSEPLQRYLYYFCVSVHYLPFAKQLKVTSHQRAQQVLLSTTNASLETGFWWSSDVGSRLPVGLETYGSMLVCKCIKCVRGRLVTK